MANFELNYTGQQVNELLAKADTALQSVPETYALKTDIPTNNNQLTNGAGYVTTDYHDSTKQDVISDLLAIRSGAELGATALQSVPDTYATKTYVTEQGYAKTTDLLEKSTETWQFTLSTGEVVERKVVLGE